MSFLINRKIFVVDDDPFCRNLYLQELKNLGYMDVQAFPDGRTCLNELVHSPDVIFLDHQMPGMHGIDVLRRILRFDPNIYTVFLSGQDDLNVPVQALKYGAFDYIIKGQKETEKMRMVMNKIEHIQTLIQQQQKTTWIQRFRKKMIS